MSCNYKSVDVFDEPSSTSNSGSAALYEVVGTPVIVAATNHLMLEQLILVYWCAPNHNLTDGSGIFF